MRLPLGQTYAEELYINVGCPEASQGRSSPSALPTACSRQQVGCSGLPLWLSRKYLASDQVCRALRSKEARLCGKRQAQGPASTSHHFPLRQHRTCWLWEFQTCCAESQCTKYARAGRDCNHCNAEFIFPSNDPAQEEHSTVY